MRKGKDQQPIIIKRVKKGGHGFHGGNWKVAMADFMTSMFMFFMVLWLLNIVSKEQREGIGNYFAPASVSRATTGSGGVLGGQSLLSDGTYRGSGGPPQILPGGGAGEANFPDLDLDPTNDEQTPLSSEQLDQVQGLLARLQDSLNALPQQAGGFADSGSVAGGGGGGPAGPSVIQDATGSGQASPLSSQPSGGATGQQAAQGQSSQVPISGVQIDEVPKGIRITLRDVEGQPMFPSGSSAPSNRVTSVLQSIAPELAAYDQFRVRIVGHTDAVPYSGGQGGYSNWELSVDRANAARRALVRGGLPADRLTEVTGRGPSQPSNPQNPRAPENRRLEIVLHPQQDVARRAAPSAGVSPSQATQQRVRSSPAPSQPATQAPRSIVPSGSDASGSSADPNVSTQPLSLQTPTRLIR